jgi:hypothetical protein
MGNRFPVWTATGTMMFVELGKKYNPYLVVTRLLLASGSRKVDHAMFFELVAIQRKHAWEDKPGYL